jgi:hypothetical protein
MRSVRAVALASIACLGCAACGSRSACPSGQTSLQLSIGVVDPMLGTQIHSIAVELSIGDQRGRKVFDPGTSLQRGRFDVNVILDTMVDLTAPLMLKVDGTDMPGGAGTVVASASEEMSLAQSACNPASVDLMSGASTNVGNTVADGGNNNNNNNGAINDAGTVGGDGGSPATDGGEGDMNGMMSPGCVPIDRDTIALYDLEGSFSSGVLADQTGFHNGRLTGSGFTSVAGPAGCGQGLAFPGAGSDAIAYGVISDGRSPGSHGRPAFNLGVGSFDLWVNQPSLPPLVSAMGIVSHDVSTAATGIALLLACDGTLVARMTSSGGPAVYQCSNAPIGADTWRHVLVNFGPPGLELIVDGVLQTKTGSVGFEGGGCAQPITCGTSTTAGLTSGESPWVLGADAQHADPESLSGVDSPFLSGEIDELRISRVRR